MLQKVRTGSGFIAALDQSGGSTPKALALYGVGDDAWSTEDEMFDLMHAMRTRIMTSPAFTGERVLGAILFEQTMDRKVEGRGTADYLWSVKNVVPFLKVDKGLADQAYGVQLMKPIPGLFELCASRRRSRRVRYQDAIGDPSRRWSASVAIVEQQFEVAAEISRGRAGADHRAGGRHQQCGEGGCRRDSCATRSLEQTRRRSRSTRR